MGFTLDSKAAKKDVVPSMDVQHHWLQFGSHRTYKQSQTAGDPVGHSAHVAGQLINALAQKSAVRAKLKGYRKYQDTPGVPAVSESEIQHH